MALSRVVKIGDGSTNQFVVDFALGYLNENDVTCRVNNEADGGGNPIYRNITFISSSLLQIDGTVPSNGDLVVFERTVPKETLLVNFTNGDIMDEINLDTQQLQLMMSVHEVLDGRFGAFLRDIDMGTFRITNMGDPVDDQDAATKIYVDGRLTTNEDLRDETQVLRDAAAADAATAAAQAGIATTQATNASASAVAAATSETNAAASETQAAAEVVNAQAEVVNCQTEVANCQAEVVNAQAEVTLAGKYADELEDVEVVPGRYSAYHWSQKALQNAAGTAAGISFNPYGVISSTDVQAALEEINDEFGVLARAQTWTNTQTFGATVWSGGTQNVSGGTFVFNDSRHCYFGTDNDMFLVHNGSTGYLTNTTGSMYIRADDAGNNADVHIQARKGDGALTACFIANADGTNAYGRVLFNGAEKLKVDGSGAYVTGRLYVTGGTSTFGASVNVTGNLDVTGNISIGTSGGGDSWSFYHDDNTNTERSFGWDDSQNCFVAEENDNGIHRLALCDTQTSSTATNFPIGHIVMAQEITDVSRNASRTIRYATNGTMYYIGQSVTSNQGSVLTGTWRSRGTAIVSSNRWINFQRVA